MIHVTLSTLARLKLDKAQKRMNKVWNEKLPIGVTKAWKIKDEGFYCVYMVHTPVELSCMLIEGLKIGFESFWFEMNRIQLW